LYNTRAELETAMERLSSGKRINSSADDAAGMTVASKMRAQIASLNQAVRNANDGISMLDTYDGAAAEVEQILVRMRELAIQADNGTYTSADITNIDLEYAQLTSEITSISSKTKWNGTVALGAAGSYSFKVGFGSSDTISVSLVALDVGSGLGSSAVGDSGAVDTALTALQSARATAGATRNRLEYTVRNVMNVSQRTQEALSRVEDADFAAESAALARANVLAQAGTAMLAQANQTPQYILTLLRG